MSKQASHLKKASARSAAPSATAPWSRESAPNPDLERPLAHSNGARRPVSEAAMSGGTGRSAVPSLSQGQRSLNGALHQSLMLSHLDVTGPDDSIEAATAWDSQAAAPAHAVTPDEIRHLAYQLYLLRHREEGHALDHWLEAERQLKSGQSLPPEVD